MALLAACSKSPGDAVADNWDLLGSFCTDCHNDADLSGELSLARFTPADVAAHPEIWEEVVRKLRGNLMPPPGGPRPEPKRVAEFVAALEDYLDESAAARGSAIGRVAVHRLNRSEYARSVEELLGVHVDVRSMLPADVATDGFDNVAEALRVSPTHLEQYIVAARDISARAVGNPRSPLARSEYRSDRANETSHVDGLPLGTRGGIAVQHYFPADGEYVFNVNVASVPAADLRAYPHGWLEYRHRVIVTIDGERVFEGELGGEEDLRAVDQQQIGAVNAIKDRFRDIRVSVKAGDRTVGATFVARSRAESDYRLAAFVPGETIPDVPRLRSLEVVGPYDPSGIAEPTESRRRIFSCYPRSEQDELPCAEEILTRLARHAFRRPVTEADLAPLLDFYRSGSAQAGFEAGIQSGITAMLVSTKFLYRAEPFAPPEGISPGEAYAVDDLELAWRLAFFLWSSGPDEELLTLAEQRRLSEPKTYQAQVRRLLADPKSKSLVTNFAFQWLGVRRLQAVDPDPKLYPYFDEDLRAAFEREMELFLDSILRNGEASILDLLTARHTYVNERLARHYGIASVRGDQFRRIELADPNRFGLLGKGSVLMVTSYPDRTSPVLRGAWIMEHLLGTPPAPVPAGVETDLTPLPGDQPRSVRERLARHRTDPSCNHCHGVIDPLGQALEGFNPIGEWRIVERESGVRIDSRGQLAGGREVSSPIDLREALAAEPELFVQSLTEKLLTYALGRSTEYYDMPAVRRIVDEAAADDYAFASVVMGIANSRPFRMRTMPPAADANETVATSSAGAAARGGN
jgi:hypothetical protein